MYADQLRAFDAEPYSDPRPLPFRRLDELVAEYDRRTVEPDVQAPRGAEAEAQR